MARSKCCTVRELKSRMTVSEFREELAYHLYCNPLPNSWQETAVLAMASFNPHVKRRHQIRERDIIPTAKPRKPVFQPIEMDVAAIKAALAQASSQPTGEFSRPR